MFNENRPYEEIEDQFDSLLKDSKIILSKDLWKIGNIDNEDIKMGAYVQW